MNEIRTKESSFHLWIHMFKYNMKLGGEWMRKASVKEMSGKKKLDYVKDIFVSLVGGYGITFLGIVILAFLLLMFQISEDMVDIGIIIIYILSCLGTGIVIGKRAKLKKFFWGMLSGGMYFLVLLIMSVMLHNSLGGEGRDLITVLLICVGSGTLGGMIS